MCCERSSDTPGRTTDVAKWEAGLLAIFQRYLGDIDELPGSTISEKVSSLIAKQAADKIASTRGEVASTDQNPYFGKIKGADLPFFRDELPPPEEKGLPVIIIDDFDLPSKDIPSFHIMKRSEILHKIDM